MQTHSIRVLFATLVLLGCAANAFSDGIMTHKPGVYKMSKFGNTSENIPLNGPVIHVFSNNGKKYTTISNDNKNLTHASTVGGICGKRSQNFSGPIIAVANTTQAVSGAGRHVIKDHTESFKFPFTLPDIPRTPAAACNFELDKRVAKGNKSRAYWMQRGFVVKYDNAYEAKFTATCTGGISRGEYVSETIKTPVWIACAATDVKQDQEPKPARMQPSRARPAPLKVRASLKASRQGTVYASKCPVTIRYTGSVYVSRPNFKLTYQIIGSDWESPERTITVEKAGNQEITGWTQYYRAKKADLNSISSAPASGGKKPDSSGNVVLKVRYDGGKTQSDPIPYKVFCNAEKPKRAILEIKQ
jgi:hypothetical protein